MIASIRSRWMAVNTGCRYLVTTPKWACNATTPCRPGRRSLSCRIGQAHWLVCDSGTATAWTPTPPNAGHSPRRSAAPWRVQRRAAGEGRRLQGRSPVALRRRTVTSGPQHTRLGWSSSEPRSSCSNEYRRPAGMRRRTHRAHRRPQLHHHTRLDPDGLPCRPRMAQPAPSGQVSGHARTDQSQHPARQRGHRSAVPRSAFEGHASAPSRPATQRPPDQKSGALIQTRSGGEVPPDSVSGDDGPKLRPHCTKPHVTGRDRCPAPAGYKAVDQW
jgi:hypothetical protein